MYGARGPGASVPMGVPMGSEQQCCITDPPPSLWHTAALTGAAVCMKQAVALLHGARCEACFEVFRGKGTSSRSVILALVSSRRDSKKERERERERERRSYTLTVATAWPAQPTPEHKSKCILRSKSIPTVAKTEEKRASVSLSHRGAGVSGPRRER